MFMGKIDWDYIKKHTKIRLKECRGLNIIGFLLGIIFLNDIFGLILLSNKYHIEVRLYTCVVYSDYALVLFTLACLYYAVTYIDYNERHQIYPHTASTQLFSYELYLGLINAGLQILSLFLYLLQYSFCLLLEHLKGNVELAYRFNLTFLFTGFFVNLFYGFLIISFLTLFTGLIRKLRWWFLIPCAALWLLVLITKNPGTAFNWVNFYLKSSSPILFFLKAIITIVIIEGLNIMINQFMDQFKAHRFQSKYIIFVSVLSVLFYLNALIGYNNQNSSEGKIEFMSSNREIDTSKDKPVCIIDSSQLPAKSKIKLKLDYMYSSYNTNVFEVPSATDEIKIYFIPDQKINNSINLMASLKPRIEASLTDNTLHVLVACEKNINVVSLYPNSTLMQFDCFKNKPYAKKYTGGSYGTIPGSIKITLPINKSFQTNVIQQ